MARPTRQKTLNFYLVWYSKKKLVRSSSVQSNSTFSLAQVFKSMSQFSFRYHYRPRHDNRRADESS